MTAFLMTCSIHGSDIKPAYIGQPWTYRAAPQEGVALGALVYLVAGQSGLYGWGYIIDVEQYFDAELRQDMLHVVVTRPVVREGIAQYSELAEHTMLAEVFRNQSANFTELSPQQANVLNSILRSRREAAPPDLPDFAHRTGKFGYPDTTSLVPVIVRSVTQAGIVSLLFIDLDNFKQVNDDYDHAVGDRVIREALDTVNEMLNDPEVLFHRSGDEMVVVLPGVDSRIAATRAEAIRSAIESREFAKVGAGFVTATLGVASLPEHSVEAGELETCADRAAVQAKKLGKNRVHVFRQVD